MTAFDMIKPPLLSPGDTIGIVAPSLPLLPSWQENYEAGKGVLRSLGFQLFEGETVHLQHWWSAGRPVEQAKDIILANVDFGHQISMLPMVIVLAARMDSEALLIEVTETAVAE